MKPLLENISQTAFLVASCRAKEGLEDEPLFNDDLAHLYLESQEQSLLSAFEASRQYPVFSTSIVVRTAVIDKLILKLIRKEGIQQVINLGAGLDNRPYRLSLPIDLIWWEIDYIDLVKYKGTTLSKYSPKCTLYRHGMDLSDLSQLNVFIKSEINQEKKTLILSEGFLIYFDSSTVVKYLSLFSNLEYCTHWLTDIGTEKNKIGKDVQLEPVYEELLQNMHFFSTPSDPIYSENNWKVKRHKDLAVEALKLNRPLGSSYGDKLSKELLELQSLHWANHYHFLLLENTKSAL